MPALRLAVFDMDGTLLDSLPDLAECCREILAQCGLPLLSDAQVRTMIGNGVQVLVERALKASLAQKEKESGVASSLPMSSEEAVSRFMAAYTPRATRLSRLFVGAEDALRSLHAQNWKLAVCTNKPEKAARRILSDFNLGSLFAAVGGGDSFVARKPDARHLLGTITQAGGIAARSVMVGDMSPDYLAAEGAECPFVFARWGYGPTELAARATADAAAMRDIPALLERIMPA
ncbi:HAD hydrolase-like protein [Acetobacter okinawensis]|uniref:HAD hydrolase-like protein n=1 Tax=Acetobacter okinawensis TaxID=1076594 RepID=UPI0004701708|nr:HAD hydrolase-like protein [Acetobacter okinawensis]